MKTFCVLEQGAYINEPLTIEKKRLFSTEFSDFYRLNWKRNDDPNAFLHEKGVSWSEGRSLLYERVPKNYQYYIFMDDDVKLIKDYTEKIDIATKIRDLLHEYQPISASFLSYNKDWRISDRTIKNKLSLSKKAFPIVLYDAKVQILLSSFADLIYPLPYHGSWGVDLHIYSLCHQLAPLKQMCFTEIKIKNERHEQKYFVTDAYKRKYALHL